MKRLKWIQAVLFLARQQDFDFVSVPLNTLEGNPAVEAAGHLWELSPWMPGRADYPTNRSTHRLETALAALARFHLAVESFPASGNGPPPAPAERLAMCLAWQGDSEIGRLVSKIEQSEDAQLRTIALRIVGQFVRLLPPILVELRSSTSLRAPILPCIRDVWHAHVLFTQDRVTGLIDYGAMRLDTPATCTSRLLASLAEDDPAGWRAGLSAYRQVRPLGREESRLLRLLDLSATLLTGMNWLRWIYLEERAFENRSLLIERLELASARLERLATGRHVWHQIDVDSLIDAS